MQRVPVIPIAARRPVVAVATHHGSERQALCATTTVPTRAFSTQVRTTSRAYITVVCGVRLELRLRSVISASGVASGYVRQSVTVGAVGTDAVRSDAGQCVVDRNAVARPGVAQHGGAAGRPQAR